MNKSVLNFGIKYVDEFIKERSMSSITQREKQVLELIAIGCTQKAIAKALYISENTVKTHRKRLLEALNAANAPHMVTRAFEMGLLVHIGQH